MTARTLLRATAVGAAALLTTLSVSSQAAPDRPGGQSERSGRLVPVQLLSFNDFHGNLEPPAGSGGRNIIGHRWDEVTKKPVDVVEDAGGAQYLATHLAQARRGNRTTITAAAGDLIGASPFLSAAFHDEPTVEALNAMRLDVSSVGNHEFDEGYRELQRMARGGCLDDGDGANGQNSCPDGSFGGADFDYLAANVKYTRSGRTVLPPYAIVRRPGGIKIGFIGMTLKDTPSIVSASGIQGLRFTDEVRTANRLVPKLRRQGVKAIVVLIHQGGTPQQQTWYGPDDQPYQVNPTYNYTCAKGGALDPTSPILPIAKRLSPQIDMVVSGHTHQPYVCKVKDPAGRNRMLTSASSFGRLFTDTTLLYDRAKNDIVRSSVRGANMTVSRDVPKDSTQTALITKYKELVRPIASEVVGSITADVTRTANAAGESQLGDLIADAQLDDPSTVTGGKQPQIAFMNPGGIRADLVYANSPYGEALGDVVFEEAFTAQPFNNYVVSMDLTGQQIYDLLAQQVSGSNAGTNRKILQVSRGFGYTLGANGAVEGSVTLDGTPIDKAASYRVVANSFLSDGGDNFAAFKAGTNKFFGGLDIDSLTDYLGAHSPYTPGPLTRINQ